MRDLNEKMAAAKDFLELYYNYHLGCGEDSPFQNQYNRDAFAGVAVYLQEKLKRDVVISDIVSFFTKEHGSLLEPMEDILNLHNDEFGSTLVRNLCHIYKYDYEDFREEIFESFSSSYAVLPDFSTYQRTDEDMQKAMQGIIDAEEAVLKQPR